MNLSFSILQKFSPDELADFLFKKILDLAFSTKNEIKKIKFYSDIPSDKEWDLLLILISFNYFIIMKALISNYKEEKRIRIVLEKLMNFIIKNLAQYKDSKIPDDRFCGYLDTLFTNNFEDFSKYNLDIKERRNLVTRVTNKVAQLLDRKTNEDLKILIVILYKKILDVMS